MIGPVNVMMGLQMSPLCVKRTRFKVQPGGIFTPVKKKFLVVFFPLNL
jgi:hypothetical protein